MAGGGLGGVTPPGHALTYDVADRHLSTTAGTTTIAYTRDAMNRVVKRIATDAGVTTTTKYLYAGDDPLDPIDAPIEVPPIP